LLWWRIHVDGVELFSLLLTLVAYPWQLLCLLPQRVYELPIVVGRKLNVVLLHLTTSFVLIEGILDDLLLGIHGDA